MTQRRSAASKLLFLVIVLTLISCCFLGNTFARYTSGETGKATVAVAEWNVTNETAMTNLNFSDMLSPSMAVYAGTNRTNKTERLLVATIRNTGDVDALVTLTTGTEPTVTAEASYGEGITVNENEVPTEAEVKEVFSIKLYTNTSDNSGGATEYKDPVDVSADGGVLYVYAEVTWTSDAGDLTGDNADKRDTWIGENVTSVSYTLSYTAVQNSVKP